MLGFADESYLFFLIVSLFLFYLLSSTHLGKDDAFKSAAHYKHSDSSATCQMIMFHGSIFFLLFVILFYGFIILLYQQNAYWPRLYSLIQTAALYYLILLCNVLIVWSIAFNVSMVAFEPQYIYIVHGILDQMINRFQHFNGPI